MTPVLLITRPKPAADRFARAVIDALGEPVRVVHAPAFEVTPQPVENFPAPAHVIFTSSNGVAQAERLKLPRVTAWCVGDRTAAAANALGFEAISAGGSAEELIALIRERQPKGPMLHVAGQNTRGDIPEHLRSSGFDCTGIAAYRQDLLTPPKAAFDLAGGTNPVVAPVFSPRSAHILVGLAWQGPLHVIAMSAAVAEEVAHLECDSILTAQSPTEAAMIDATSAKLRALLDR